MSSAPVIKYFAGQFAAIVKGDKLLYVEPKSVRGTSATHDAIVIGSYVKFYYFTHDAEPGDFESDYEVGNVLSIDSESAGDTPACVVGTICCAAGTNCKVYLHHIRLANARDIARAVFHIGDKVVVLDGSPKPQLVGSWSIAKDSVVGHVSTVSVIEADGALRLREFESLTFSPEFVRRATDEETSARFKVGDKVVCDAEHREYRIDGPGEMYWAPSMTALIGKVGEVCAVVTRGDAISYVVRTNGARHRYNGSWLRPAEPGDSFAFKVGDEVICDARPGEGAWSEQMDATIGIVGRVMDSAGLPHGDRIYDVQFDGSAHAWYLRSWLRAVPPEEKAAIANFDAALEVLASSSKIGAGVAAAKVKSALGKRKAVTEPDK